jgi:chromosome partitioning protein
MAHILSIVSSKGGCGKTTVALNLAVALAEAGDNTLLIDVDPLGAIGFSLAQSDTAWRGLAECMMDNQSIDEVIMPTKLPTLSLLPRGRLDPLDVAVYEEQLHASTALPDIIAAVADRYRYIIIDTPSGLGMVTRAALSISNFVLLPLQAEALALRSISQTLRVLMHVKEHENPGLELLGILATMVQMNKDVSFKIITTVWETLSGILETYIPRADIYSIASEKGLPVAFLPGQFSPEAARFQLLVTEIKGIIQGLGGVTGETDERAQRELL